MNLQQASRRTGLTPEEIFERVGKTKGIKLGDINPLLSINSIEEQAELEYVTVQKAAEILGYSVQHIYTLMSKGDLPFVQVGRRKFPLKAGLNRDESTSNTEAIDRLIENDPTLRVYILEKYGIEGILERLNRIEITLKGLADNG